MSDIKPDCDRSAPFLMWVEEIIRPRHGICIVIGFVERGSLNLYARIEVVGEEFVHQTLIADVEQFHKKATTVRCGEQAGVLLANEPKEIRQGYVIAAPGSIQACTKFRGNIQLTSEAEGSANHVFIAGEEVQFFFRNVYVPGIYTFLDGFDLIAPANRVILICMLTRAVAMEEGQEFTVYSGGKVIGAGKVVELITNLDVKRHL